MFVTQRTSHGRHQVIRPTERFAFRGLGRSGFLGLDFLHTGIGTVVLVVRRWRGGGGEQVVDRCLPGACLFFDSGAGGVGPGHKVRIVLGSLDVGIDRLEALSLETAAA